MPKSADLVKSLNGAVSGAVPSRFEVSRLPRLWNAHKPIKTVRLKLERGRLLNTHEKYLLRRQMKAAAAKEPETKSSSEQEDKSDRNSPVTVPDDIVQFIDKADLSPKECYELLRNPPYFFSRPGNVPEHLRQQVYFPWFTVTFYRTPHLPPKYASFDVPLWFNKLDLKDYLRSVYNVQVLHVRSTVVQAKIQREHPIGRGGHAAAGYGRWRRPTSTKRMTAELVEPFVWPEAIKDLSPWENDGYWKSNKEQFEFQKTLQPDAILRPNEKQRKSIAEQANELLEGKARWKPTWQSIPTDVRVIEGERSLKA